MTLLLDDATVRELFSWSGAASALREAYTTDVEPARFPARSMARGDQAWLRTLSGAPGDTGLMGLKSIAAALSSRHVSYLISLFDQSSAELVALLDGHSITGYRTAATSALAADILATSGALSVAVIGSGFEAQNHLRAIAAVRAVNAVRVYSPRPESRARFIGELSELGLAISAEDEAQAAVRDATLVICAARSRDESPTLRGEWLAPGSTVVSIGSTLPEQREVDSETMRRADLIVADELREVLDETGDALAARRDGVDLESKTVSLSDLVSGRVPGRQDDQQVLLYKSVGGAIQDLAVAAMCVARAREAGLGATLPVDITPVAK
jgi:ornithine cyclodeaminase/alanine dehydrogenase